MKIIASLILTSLSLVASAAYGVTIGELQAGGGTTGTGIPGTPLTFINVSRPAAAPGSVTNVRLVWNGAPDGGCTNAYKVKFFRALSMGQIQVLGSYGPFNVQNGVNDVTIPALSIVRGDWIGATQMNSTCGGISLTATDASDTHGVIFGDPSSTATQVSFSGGYLPNIVASSTPDVLQGHFLVAGSLRGNLGAEFKTSAQLTNLGNSTITGKLVFHPANTPTQDSAKFINYSLAPLKTISYDDVVQAMGASGLGTMDLVLTSGYPPDVSVRIYNDAGANGTSGLTEDIRTARHAHERFQFGTFIIPADLTKFRLNIGYRTLGEGASLSIYVFDANGSRLTHIANRELPANTMAQESAPAFTQQSSLPPGGLIYFQVTAGRAFFYGATTDNKTNDPNLRFATKY